MATSSSPFTALYTSFLYSTPSSQSMAALPRRRRPGCRYPRIQAVDLDQNTIVAISVGVVSVAIGIGIPVFYETQIDNAYRVSRPQEESEKKSLTKLKELADYNSETGSVKLGGADAKAAFYHLFRLVDAGEEGQHTGVLPLQRLWRTYVASPSSSPEVCRFCTGKGTVTVVIGGGETEVSNCVNCDGVGSLTCTTCQGTGIQPRYLDRREFKDDD